MLPEREPNLLAIVGSATPPGRLRRAVEEATDRAAAATLIDLADRSLPLADGRPLADSGPDAVAVVEAIEGAGAVILATPVYRGSMTGALKNLLDLTPVEALAAKPVGLVAMGASDHHYLGADRHLRDVLAFFGALAMPVGVYLNSSDFEDGVPTAAAASKLDELFAATLGAATTLGPDGVGGPAPMAARAGRKR